MTRRIHKGRKGLRMIGDALDDCRAIKVVSSPLSGNRYRRRAQAPRRADAPGSVLVSGLSLSLIDNNPLQAARSGCLDFRNQAYFRIQLLP